MNSAPIRMAPMIEEWKWLETLFKVMQEIYGQLYLWFFRKGELHQTTFLFKFLFGQFFLSRHVRTYFERIPNGKFDKTDSVIILRAFFPLLVTPNQFDIHSALQPSLFIRRDTNIVTQKRRSFFVQYFRSAVAPKFDEWS